MIPTPFCLSRVPVLGFLTAGLLALLAPTGAQAQEAAEPDYRQIAQTIGNHKSPNYYPTLVSRYLANDTTLSLENYRNLYYGFALQEDFVPYQDEKAELLDIRRKIAETGGSKDICPEAIRISRAILDDNPFNLLAIATLASASLQTGDTVSFLQWQQKQQGLLDAILSSGDGDSPATAFHVISLEHEYEVLSRLGLEVESDSLCNGEIEYLRVKENASGERGFYFNFGACSRIYNVKYK